jgi:hypothetical protein
MQIFCGTGQMITENGKKIITNIFTSFISMAMTLVTHLQRYGRTASI